MYTPSQDDSNRERLRYPIERLREDPQPTPEKHQRWIDLIEALPGELRALVQDLSDRRLDTPYRPGGWTIRQVVHHLADSHMNGYIRTKLAVTEDVPTVKPFDEEAWATLPDSCLAPPELSLRLLEALHGRWVATLRSLDEPALLRKLHHPEDGTQNVSRIIQGFAWHGPPPQRAHRQTARRDGVATDPVFLARHGADREERRGPLPGPASIRR